MKSDLIIRAAMEKSTKILAGENVNVFMEGFTPKIVWDEKLFKAKEIILPTIPDSCSRELLNAVKGMQNNQVSRALYSNVRDVISKSKDAVWHHVHTAIDSCHTDRKMLINFPGTYGETSGAYSYLYKNSESYKQSNIDQLIDYSKKEAQANYISLWIAEKMNDKFRGKFYHESGISEIYKEWDDRLSDELKSALASCSSADDVRNLTNQIIEFLDDETKETLKDRLESGGESGESDDKKEGDGEGDNRGKSSGKGDSESKPKPKKSKRKSDDSDSDSDTGENGDGEKQDDDSESDDKNDGKKDDKPSESKDTPKPKPIKMKPTSSISEDLDEIVSSEIEDLFDNGKPFFWSNRMNELVYASSMKYTAQPLTMEKFDIECKATSNFIRKKLERLLQQKNRVYYTGGFKRGKLGQKGLAFVPTGKDDIFMKKNEVTAMNTAVSILVDMSGSMNGNKIKIAFESAYALSECLFKLKIPYEILGFWTDRPLTMSYDEVKPAYYDFLETVDTKTKSRVINGYDVDTTLVFKGFDESLNYRHRSAMVKASDGSIGMNQNNDCTHVKVALERISVRPEKKKVLFVLSDGMPCFDHNNVNSANGVNALRSLAENAKKDYDTTIVGIGILDSSVIKFYKNASVIRTLKDLPEAVFDTLSKQLLERVR